MSQWECETVTCNWRKARENVCVQSSDWFWFFFSLVEKVARFLPINNRAKQYRSMLFRETSVSMICISNIEYISWRYRLKFIISSVQKTEEVEVCLRLEVFTCRTRTKVAGLFALVYCIVRTFLTTFRGRIQPAKPAYIRARCCERNKVVRIYSYRWVACECERSLFNKYILGFQMTP